EARRALLAREILEHALAAEAGLGVFTDGTGRGRRRRSRGAARRERVDVAAGEDHDARALEVPRDVHGHDGVVGPGEVGAVGGAELPAGQVEDVRYAGE